MRLLTATVLVSMAVFGQAMPVIHIATGPHWTTAQPAPAPPPEVSDVQTFREAGQPQAATSGTAASSRPVGRPVAFSADDASQSDKATTATGSAPQPPAGATPFSAAQAAPQVLALAPSTAVTPQASTLNSDPTGWSGAIADQQQAATPGFGAQQPGMTSFGGVPGASSFATPGMTPGFGTGMGTGTGTFTPVSVATPSSNPDTDRASALAQQVQSGGTPAASAMSGGFPGSTFGTPGFTGVPGTTTFGAPMVGMPTTGGASGVIDPFTQQGGILGTQQAGTGAGTPGFGTTPGSTMPGFPGTSSGFPGTSSGFPSTGFPTTPGAGTPGMGTTGGDMGLGVQTRRDTAAAQ